MEIRYLRHFLAVAEELHFARAAQRLNMEQAPLSQSIKRLESWLGVTLFDRSNRQTRLTDAGSMLVDEASKAVLQFERAVGTVRQAAEAQPMPLAIGFVTAGILRLLPLAIRRFRAERLETSLRLTEASTVDLLAGVAGGTLDLALVHPTHPCPPGIVLERSRATASSRCCPRPTRSPAAVPC